MSIKVSKITTAAELDQCLTIRQEVFVKGQNVPLADEVDGLDQSCEHYLLWLNSVAVGTTRVRLVNDYAKIERVALLADYRGCGLGKYIMQQILADLQRKPGIVAVKLSAQTYAINFYEKLGFMICSNEYMDAGIPHKDMILALHHPIFLD